MRSSILLSVLATSQLSAARPPPSDVNLRSLDAFENAFLLDSPAYSTESSSASKGANFRVYKFLGSSDDEIREKLDDAVLPDLLQLIPGLDDVGDGLTTLVSRLAPFLALPRGDSEVSVHVSSCESEQEMALGKTNDTTGFLERNVDLSDCAFEDEDTERGEIKGSELGSERDGGVNNTIFFSPPDGWGVISDIDDTIKDSEVNDLFKLISNTLLKPFEAVRSMPNLLASLSASLATSDAPSQFIYLTSSPIQLYPSLQPFIRDNFPAGPLLLRNYTFTDIPTLIDNLKLPTQEYKVGELRKVHQWYPAKKYLLVGDSTQEDPEAYGEAFREFGGDWVGCIWIRAVEGSDNDDSRFDDAFEGVPRKKWRVFSDPVADGLTDVDVAGGSC